MRKLLLLALTALWAFAFGPVVSAKEAAQMLGAKDLVILDVSAPKVYAKGHIPGALNAPIGLWRAHHGSYLLVRSPKEIEALIQKLGIDENSRVLIYSHHGGKDLLKASYVAWALELHGITKSAILDGGFTRYKKMGLPVSKETPKITPSHYKVHLHSSIVIDKQGVYQNIGKVRMLDARPPDFYFGARKQEVLPRAGHIPHATSYFWKYSFYEDGTFKPKEVLKQMLIKGLGLNPNETVITYCTGGLETSMNWFVLHRILGFSKVRLYDASMKEWANDAKMPLTKYRWE